MIETGSRLASAWRRAASLLGLEIVTPFVATLPSGSRVDADVLVKKFGAPNGMLLITDYSKVRHHLGALKDAGFGFSVLEEPDEPNQVAVDEFVDILRDWGWTGDSEHVPPWMQ